jgi:hypothetical protein
VEDVDGRLLADGGTDALGEDATLLAPGERGPFYRVGRTVAATIDRMDDDVDTPHVGTVTLRNAVVEA